jgi:pathogenesis-related protein 1
VKTSWAVQIVAMLAWLTLLSASAWPEPEPPTPEWVDAMVQAHNSIRNRSKLPPLVWSSKVAAVAQQWAEVLLARNEFTHRPKAEYGENLYEIRGAISSPAQVVSDWGSESRNYDYRTNSCRDVCGHYTQIVWRDTRELGCGVARNARREVWVCDYNPSGNWVGRRPF